MATSSDKPKTRNKWQIGVPQVCKTCGELRDYEDFHAAGKTGQSGTRRTECKHCRNPKVARYAYERVWSKEPCYFCDKPGIYMSYCSEHWQQYRHDQIKDAPEFQQYLRYTEYTAKYFGMNAHAILYSTSHKAMMVHIRMVAMIVIRHVAKAKLDKLAILFGRNLSNIVRTVQRGNRFYVQFPEFKEDVDGVLALMREDGIIE